MSILRASCLGVVLTTVYGLATTTAASPQGSALSAAALLNSARQAIGIRPDRPSPRSLRITGTFVNTQGVQGDLRTGVTRVVDFVESIELLIAFPDRFVHIGRPEQHLTERRYGFDGTKGIQRSRALAPDVQTGSGGSPSREVVDFWRQEFARLAIGVLGRTDTLRRITVDRAGPRALRLRGSVDPEVTLELDPDTPVPVRLTWRQRMIVREPGSILRTGGTPASIGPGRLPSNTPEEAVTMTFADRRDVDGFMLPFRVTWMAKGVTLREMQFDRIEVNPTLTNEDFR